MDGWNTILSYWGPAYFEVLLLLFSGSVAFSCLFEVALTLNQLKERRGTVDRRNSSNHVTMLI